MPESASSELNPPVVTLPQPQLATSDATGARAALAHAESLSVSSEIEFVSATEFARACKLRREALDKTRKSFTDPLKQLAARWSEVFQPAVNAYASAEALAREKFTAYRIEEERRARQQKAAADEAARKERERLEREAAKAEGKGKIERAAALRETAAYIPEQTTAPAPPEAAGTSFRIVWRCRVSDLLALVRYVAEHPEQLALLEPAQSTLDRLAGTFKEKLAIPGLVAVSETRSVLR